MMILRPGQRVAMLPAGGLQVVSGRATLQGTGALVANLVSYWSMEEASSTRVDSHGDNDLSPVTNDPAQATGKIGYAASFDPGSVHKLRKTTPHTLGITGADFTVAGWVYCHSLYPSLYYRTIFRIGGAWSTGGIEGKIAFNSNLAVIYYGLQNNNAVVHAGVPTNAWTFFATKYVYSARTLSVKANAGAWQDYTHEFTDRGEASGSWCIGGDDYSSSNQFDGEIDEIGVWTEALSDELVSWLYNSGNGRSYAEISAY